MESTNIKSTAKIRQTDIAIIGAGVGGCIAALALASKYSVVLIDKHALPPPKVGESLPPAAKRIFHKLNISDIGHQGHLTSVGMASSWGSEQVQYADHLRNPEGAGWHVDRQRLEARLRTEAVSRGIGYMWSYALESSEKHNEGWRLNLISNSGEQLLPVQAKLVIDATGRHCTFARQQGAKRQQDDKLVSVWMTFDSHHHNQFAHICPTESGWWYCAPIPRVPDGHDASKSVNARILSYQTDADLLPKDFTNKDILWQAATSLPQFNEVLSKANETSMTVHGKVPANSSLLSVAEDSSWFAIGDAAMSFDPLSSQGMFNAMASAMQLADLLLEEDIESPQSLASVAREYRQQLSRIWQYYQHHKKRYYGQERRWVDCEFWKRRITS